MTVQNTIVKNVYVGNGSTTVFPFTFECNKAEHIQAFVKDAVGNISSTTNFKVNLDQKNVTYPNTGEPLPDGYKLIILRQLPLQQLLNLLNQGPFYAEDIEETFDEVVMMLQQMTERIGRSLAVSIDIDAENSFNTIIPLEAGKTFRVKDDGTGFEVTEDPGKVIDGAKALLKLTTEQAELAKEQAAASSQSAVSAQNAATSVQKYKALWFDSVAAMKAEPSLTAGAYVCTAGYYEPNDGGSASYFIREKLESDTDDGGSLHELQNGLVAELIIENGTINVKQFGAVGNGVADDTVAIQNAINAKYKVLVPEGSYLITSDIDIPSRTYIKGKGELSILVFANASLSMVGTSIINGGPHKRDLILENIYLFQSSKYTSKPCILLESTTYIKFYDVFIMSPRSIIFKEVFDSTFDSCSFEWWGSTSDDSVAGVEFVQGASDYGTYENNNCMLFSRCRWEGGYQNAIKITGSDLYGQTHDITFETCHFETIRACGKVLNLEKCALNFDNCEFVCNDDIPNYFMYVTNSQLINVKNCSFGYIQGSGDVSTYSPFYIVLQKNGGLFNLLLHDVKRKSFASYKDVINTYQNAFFISGDICISYITPVGSVEKWDNNYEKIKLLQDKQIAKNTGWFSGTAGEEVTKQFTIQLSRFHGKLVEITIGDYQNNFAPMYNGLFYIPANGNDYVYSILKPPIKELNVFNNSSASGSHKFNNVSVSIDYAQSLIQTLTVKFTPVDTSTALQVNVNVTEL